jgi:hypothetical protein
MTTEERLRTPSSTDDGDAAIHGTPRVRDPPLNRDVVPSPAHDGVAAMKPRSPEVGSDWRTTPDFSSLRFGLVLQEILQPVDIVLAVLHL